MLTVTPRHFAAFALSQLDEELREAVLAQLVEMEYCSAERLEDPALREALNQEMEIAAKHGVASRDGFVEVLAHRFDLGEDWMERPAVQAIFCGVPRDELELLSALYSATANPAP